MILKTHIIRVTHQSDQIKALGNSVSALEIINISVSLNAWFEIPGFFFFFCNCPGNWCFSGQLSLWNNVYWIPHHRYTLSSTIANASRNLVLKKST